VSGTAGTGGGKRPSIVIHLQRGDEGFLRNFRRFIGELFADKADVSECEALKGYVRPGAERDAIDAF